ncbi:ImmA/IrrE family metallo-endopeptidase [Corynebacterium sputi]|uniref:ImmA/IrrE family metallo-endopeptidase n=1 Tax=Corynebacterium sputi TaxID=489915 RepID=UPI00047D1FFD|nr:ImmA/IrrE family metallo-endopeptidase [Corynebacterium sputi]
MNAEAEGRAAADKFRSTHKLGTQPLGDLLSLIERTTGHDIAVLDVHADEHGLTIHDPANGAVFIGIARTPNPMRQRSTIAHELAHVIFEDWKDEGFLGDHCPEETRANSFARHLLVPQDGLRDLLRDRTNLTDKDLSEVVQTFLVSPAIAAIALKQGGYIDASTKESWMKLTTPRLATKFGWPDLYQAFQSDSNRTRAPQKLLARAIYGYEYGVIDAQKIATLRGISRDDALRELEEAGITANVPSFPVVEASALPSIDIDLSILDDPREATEP